MRTLWNLRSEGCPTLVPQAGRLPPPLPTVWISLYYVGFYVVMTGIFALCIYTLMCTLDPYTPDYQDQLKSPGNVAGVSRLDARTPRIGAAPAGGPRVLKGHTRVGTAPQLLLRMVAPDDSVM